jgi:hypothetical protein
VTGALVGSFDLFVSVHVTGNNTNSSKLVCYRQK